MYPHGTMKPIAVPPAALLACLMLAMTTGARSADRTAVLNAADEKFIKEAAAGGNAEIQLGTLASKKAESPEVKAFAEMMVRDHTAANAELEALAHKKNVDLSAVIAPKSASTFQSLEKYSGKDFDKEYLKEMESDHKKDVADFESAAKKSGDLDLKTFIDRTLPVVRQHLDKVKELRSK